MKLTKVSITLDFDLMSTASRVWSKDLNSFIFHFGPASITLRDISIFTRFPVKGSKAVCLLDVHDPFFLILKFLPLPKLLTHPPYGSGELLLGYLLPHNTYSSYGLFFSVLSFFVIQVSLPWSIFLWLGPLPLGGPIFEYHSLGLLIPIHGQICE